MRSTSVGCHNHGQPRAPKSKSRRSEVKITLNSMAVDHSSAARSRLRQSAPKHDAAQELKSETMACHAVLCVCSQIRYRSCKAAGADTTQKSRSSMKILTSRQNVRGFTTFSWVWQCVIPAPARDREVSPHQHYSTARLRPWFVGCILDAAVPPSPPQYAAGGR